MQPFPTLVDQRRLVPGELRHIDLEAGESELDLLGTIRGFFGQRPPGKPIVCTPLTIGTWGVAAEGLAIPWSQIDRATHTSVERSSNDNRVIFSQLDFELDDRILRGERAYEVALDVLGELHPKLVRECTRPLAKSLDRARASDGAASFEELLGSARSWLTSEEGRSRVTQVGGDYRNATRAIDAELQQELKIALVEAPIDGDRGPFAAVLAAELGLATLEEELAALTSSPQGLVAAIAIGASLRLGVSPVRVGKPEHVEPYIDAATSRAIAAWGTGA